MKIGRNYCTWKVAIFRKLVNNRLRKNNRHNFFKLSKKVELHSSLQNAGNRQLEYVVLPVTFPPLLVLTRVYLRTFMWNQHSVKKALLGCLPKLLKVGAINKAFPV